MLRRAACRAPALIDELFRDADATVVLDEDGRARGFAMLRRFGRGHAIGPVVAPEAEGAQALIAHLAGLNAGRFTRIDIDFDSGLTEWLESLGLLRVDAATTMVRGAPLAPDADARLYAIVTQALGLMRPVFVYKADGQRGRQWAEIFRHEAPEIDFRLWPEIGDAHAVRYLATWVRRPTWVRSSRSSSCCSPPAPVSTSSTSPRCRRTCRWCAWWNPASCRAWSST